MRDYRLTFWAEMGAGKAVAPYGQIPIETHAVWPARCFRKATARGLKSGETPNDSPA